VDSDFRVLAHSSSTSMLALTGVASRGMALWGSRPPSGEKLVPAGLLVSAAGRLVIRPRVPNPEAENLDPRPALRAAQVTDPSMSPSMVPANGPPLVETVEDLDTAAVTTIVRTPTIEIEMGLMAMAPVAVAVAAVAAGLQLAAVVRATTTRAVDEAFGTVGIRTVARRASPHEHVLAIPDLRAVVKTTGTPHKREAVTPARLAEVGTMGTHEAAVDTVQAAIIMPTLPAKEEPTHTTGQPTITTVCLSTLAPSSAAVVKGLRSGRTMTTTTIPPSSVRPCACQNRGSSSPQRLQRDRSIFHGLLTMSEAFPWNTDRRMIL
jgi:hypothetical protein